MKRGNTQICVTIAEDTRNTLFSVVVYSYYLIASVISKIIIDRVETRQGLTSLMLTQVFEIAKA